MPLSDNSIPSETGAEENEDLFASLDDHHWKSCSEEQKLAATTSSFSFVVNIEGKNN